MTELPLIYPSATGVPGIISVDPVAIQCQECARIDTVESLGLGEWARHGCRLVVHSRIRFHPSPWTSGHTDNPRLCIACRLARGCECTRCSDERRDYEKGWRP